MKGDLSPEFQFMMYLTIKVYVVEYTSKEDQVLINFEAFENALSEFKSTWRKSLGLYAHFASQEEAPCGCLPN